MNTLIQKMQKQYGVKLGKYDTEKNRLFNKGVFLLKVMQEYVEEVEKAGLTNEQFFIDWEIDANELTVKDHNKKT